MSRNTRLLPVFIDQRFIVGIVFILLNITFAILSPVFFKPGNYLNMLIQSSTIIITGCGATLLMMTGNFDLSTGSNVAFNCVFYSYLAVAGVPLPVAAAASILAGAMFGVVNGTLVARVGFPPFIASLGMMYIGRGLALVACNGMSVRSGIPSDFGNLAMGSILGVPTPVMLIVAFLAVFWLIERRTLLGKYALAIGGNKTAAVFSGINAGGIVFFMYVLVGSLAGFAGVLTASRIGAGDPRSGNGFEFDVILAVILGGTSLNGGKGSVLGMFLGAMTVVVLGNGLNMLNVLPFWQSILKGIILVLAIVLHKSLESGQSSGMEARKASVLARVT